MSFSLFPLSFVGSFPPPLSPSPSPSPRALAAEAVFNPQWQAVIEPSLPCPPAFPPRALLVPPAAAPCELSETGPAGQLPTWPLQPEGWRAPFYLLLLHSVSVPAGQRLMVGRLPSSLSVLSSGWVSCCMSVSWNVSSLLVGCPVAIVLLRALSGLLVLNLVGRCSEKKPKGQRAAIQHSLQLLSWIFSRLSFSL